MSGTGLRGKLLLTTTALSVAMGSFAPVQVMAQGAVPETVAPDTPAADAPAPAVPEVAPETAPAQPAPEETAPLTAPSEAEPAPAEDAPEVDTPEAPPAPLAEGAPETPEPAPAEPSTTSGAPAQPADPRSAVPEDAPAPSEAPSSEAPSSEAPRAAVPEEVPAPTASEPTATPRAEVPDTDAPAGTSAPETAMPGEGASTPDTAPEGRSPAPETTADETPVPEAPDAEPQTTPTAQAVESLQQLLGGATTGGTIAATGAAGDAAAATETTTRITEEDARSSDEDFTTTAAGERRDKDDDDDDGLSNLQKVGLLALGGLAVGALLNNGDEVVSNTGDRVVVRQDDGNYAVLKDDDALLRQPGSTVRTENFTDGSTRSTVDYADGTRVVTVRDASGRVLRRDRVVDGTETRLIDDTAQAEPVDVSLLPRSRGDTLVRADDPDALRDALARIETRENARAYSLAQIRDYREVRALAPVVDVEDISFATGSAAVTAAQAENLSDLGTLLRNLIADRPTEIFLIEGHTDAVGSPASNLALSDRRAESVALALTEYFDVPPENLVVQGYGESDLRVQTDGDEPRNRRVAVRILTPILQTAQR